ncbi:MAG: hypothetical protein F6K47_30795 [Symploca sp. SIO2E6]|nr:hypothetical protein [Symploca sp. SIO2E6]
MSNNKRQTTNNQQQTTNDKQPTTNNKQQTTNNRLPQQSVETLEAILSWLDQEDDAFEKRLRADVDAGKLDQLIANVVAEDELGETIDIETSCN